MLNRNLLRDSYFRSSNFFLRLEILKTEKNVLYSPRCSKNVSSISFRFSWVLLSVERGKENRLSSFPENLQKRKVCCEQFHDLLYYYRPSSYSQILFKLPNVCVLFNAYHFSKESIDLLIEVSVIEFLRKIISDDKAEDSDALLSLYNI